MYVCVGTEWHTCEGQRTTCSYWLAPSTTWVWGIELRSPGLFTKSLCLLNNLTSPTSDFFGLFVCDNKSAISLRNCWCLLAMLGYTGELEGRLYQIVSSLGVVLDSVSLSPVRTGLRHFCSRPSLRQRQSQCWLVDCCPLHRVAVWLLTTPYANNFLKTFKREFCLVQ